MKFKVTRDKIEFSDARGKIIIPAEAEFKFIFYRWDTVGFGHGGYKNPAVGILASKYKIKNKLPFIWRLKAKDLHFDYYKEVKELVKEIKDKNFPLGLDIFELERILSKSVTEHTIISKDGIKHFAEPSDKHLEFIAKHGIKTFLIIFVVIMLLILLAAIL